MRRSGAIQSVLITPPHPGLIPRRDIVRVDQDLVFLLLAPNTDTAIRRVVEYGANRRMRPSSRVTMTIPRLAILARWRHTIVGELLRDVAQAGAIGIHAVNPLDNRRYSGVGFEAMEPLTEIALAGFGCGSASTSR